MTQGQIARDRGLTREDTIELDRLRKSEVFRHFKNVSERHTVETVFGMLYIEGQPFEIVGKKVDLVKQTAPEHNL
jgi:hypothetical protein